jgi:hypothetical protein
MILAGHMSTIVMLFLVGKFKFACQRAVPLCCCPHWAVGIVLPIIFGGLIGACIAVGIPYTFWMCKVFAKKDEIIRACEHMDRSNNNRNQHQGPPIASGTLIMNPQPPRTNVFHSQPLPVANAVSVPIQPNGYNGSIPVAQFVDTSAVNVETVG